jgi:anti-anti-sigma factor
LSSELQLEEIDVVPLTNSTCRVEMTRESGTVLYRLHGELDAVTAGEVRSMLAASRDESSVVLDLVELTALDAEGVEVIREVIDNVYRHGGHVAISRSWRLAVRMTGLMGTNGLVFLSFLPASSVEWLDRLPPSLFLSTAVATGTTFSGSQLTLGR